ncbi:MAG: hypothetical protein JWP97_6726 [Labilithrix sp.]|nr:hypothetical protein [Labilithrix sp.]
MVPAAAAAVLRDKLSDPTKPVTVADASVASGLALHDAESGLTLLTSEYRGHLRVTEDGDLLYLFPTGFTKPWETRERTQELLARAGRALLGVGRFVVRAWLLVAMVGYALAFVALFVALMAARSNDSRGGNGGGALMAGLFRAIAEAAFWTFHPFSPVYAPSYGYGYGYESSRRSPGARGDEVPFYEKVNRFVFGPPKPAPDPQAMRRLILAEIRAQRGRIGLADVMRVTGLPRDEADPLMARLMLEHDGSVHVGESGGIIYRFEALRRTAAEAGLAPEPRPPAAWERPATLTPLTGNKGSSNLVIALLNGFNLAASGWVLANGLTVSNIITLVTTHTPKGSPPLVLPSDGVPLAFGLVPLVFSLGLFALPLVRGALQLREAARVRQENARLEVLREVLTRATRKEPVPDAALRSAVRIATGADPSSQEITRRVVELGGDVDTGPGGEIRYRFADLEAEAEELELERDHASPAEAAVGRVVFASDD